MELFSAELCQIRDSIFQKDGNPWSLAIDLGFLGLKLHEKHGIHAGGTMQGIRYCTDKQVSMLRNIHIAWHANGYPMIKGCTVCCMTEPRERRRSLECRNRVWWNPEIFGVFSFRLDLSVSLVFDYFSSRFALSLFSLPMLREVTSLAHEAGLG